MDLNRRVAVFAAVVLALALSLTGACGNGGDDEPTSTRGAAGTAAAPAGRTPAAGADNDDAEEGRKLAGARCLSCHTTDGRASVGPTWKGLYGSEVELESGEKVIADEDYIEESILDPTAKVHKDFAPAMPSFQGQLSEDEIEAIIAYIQTLN